MALATLPLILSSLNLLNLGQHVKAKSHNHQSTQVKQQDFHIESLIQFDRNKVQQVFLYFIDIVFGKYP